MVLYYTRHESFCQAQSLCAGRKAFVPGAKSLCRAQSLCAGRKVFAPGAKSFWWPQARHQFGGELVAITMTFAPGTKTNII